MTPFLARQERFSRVASTQDVVRGWLDAGSPEVCLAVADEQTDGRGRSGRTWVAPPGRALLLSVGFRPTWLAPGHAWRLAATVSLAMADAAEEAAGLRDRAIGLKWPNDLVIEDAAPDLPGGESARGRVRKLGGVLGESDGLGTAAPRVVVGIGLNADWPVDGFPADLAPSMTSLRVASNGRPIDPNVLLDGFLSHLEARVEALRVGRFDVGDWAARQVTTGRQVRLEGHAHAAEECRAVGVDPATGALLVADPQAPGGERAVNAGEVTRIRIAETVGPRATVAADASRLPAPAGAGTGPGSAPAADV
jgi:BirA family biotin operon repressor/biotin-[acetyl-CoA-carboxylase] ligase